MLTPSVHSPLEIPLPGLTTVHPRWCGDNPDVDRSAPPRPAAPAKKKGVKKKAGAKKKKR